MDPTRRGPDWMKITPVAGSLFHERTQLRAMLLQVFYTIRSERQLMERLEFDLLFRWFVGIDRKSVV